MDDKGGSEVEVGFARILTYANILAYMQSDMQLFLFMKT